MAAAEGGAVERMLTVGLNHVATLTNDAARLHAFYEEVFEAEVVRDAPEVDGQDAVRLSIIKIGPYAELNVFQIDGQHRSRPAGTHVRTGPARPLRPAGRLAVATSRPSGSG